MLICMPRGTLFRSQILDRLVGTVSQVPRGDRSRAGMAGRFVFQKLASGMSRSTGRLSARASAPARAAAPAILTPRASARTKFGCPAYELGRILSGISPVSAARNGWNFRIFFRGRASSLINTAQYDSIGIGISQYHFHRLLGDMLLQFFKPHLNTINILGELKFPLIWGELEWNIGTIQ